MGVACILFIISLVFFTLTTPTNINVERNKKRLFISALALASVVILSIWLAIAGNKTGIKQVEYAQIETVRHVNGQSEQVYFVKDKMFNITEEYRKFFDTQNYMVQIDTHTRGGYGIDFGEFQKIKIVPNFRDLIDAQFIKDTIDRKVEK